jgi:hypothetical protein
MCSIWNIFSQNRQSGQHFRTLGILFETGIKYGKATTVLVRATTAYRRHRHTVPLILNLGNEQRWAQSTSRFTSEKKYQYPLKRMPGGSQSRSDCCEEEKNIYPYRDSNPRIAQSVPYDIPILCSLFFHLKQYNVYFYERRLGPNRRQSGRLHNSSFQGRDVYKVTTDVYRQQL